MANKKLWLIWRSEKSSQRSRFRIGTLSWNPEEDVYTFQYDSGNDLVLAKEAGFSFFPGFEDLEKKYTYKNELFPNIAARLPKVERDDYLDVLNRYNLNMSDGQFTVLSATKGRQITDNFEFVPVFDENKIEFDVAGVNHRNIEEIEESAREGYLTNGAKLMLEHEEDNEYDANAVRVILPTGKKNIFLGYVPRYYSEQLLKKIKSDIEYSAVIAKVDMSSKIRDEKISALVRLMFAK